MSRKSLTAMLLVLLFLALITGLGMALTGDPLATFRTTLFIGSGDCNNCHSNLLDEEGQDITFATLWRSSMMANSAKDPLWLAKVESEVLRTPSIQAAIEDKCSICHMPMANTQAKRDGTAVAIFGDGFINPGNGLHVAAMDGISCSLCHQIGSEGLGDPKTFSGHYPIDTATMRGRLIYGRYPDPSVMRMAGYDAAYGLHMGDSDSCATCHTLYTTAYDKDGNVKGGPFPEQVPFLEWQNSSFSQGEVISCQDCHLPPVTGAVPIARGRWAPLRTDFGRHYFDGSNAFILEMLRDNGNELEVAASTKQFNQAIRRTEDQLAQGTALITVVNTDVSDTTLTVDLLVQNLTGHKFPTGIPIRRSWIHLTAVDGAGQTIFESGAPLADGRISGNDADEDLATYEPHYREITAPDQVQIYETVLADWNGDVTYTLLRATDFAKDNRLLPAGFDIDTAPLDVQVFGKATSDLNFIGGQDNISYAIPVEADSWPVTVTAELFYQPVAYSFVQDLAIDAAAFGEHFLGYNATADQSPDLISTEVTVIE